MRFNRFFLYLILANLIGHLSVKAETKSSLFLRAVIPLSLNTKIRQMDLNSNKSLWILTSQNNSQYPLEGRKYEVQGLNQEGMEAHIKKVITKDRTIQHEILISHLKSSIKKKVIILKISAN